MLELENITVDYDSCRALDHFSASVPDGKITTILGPSGCGKTTLLNVVAGMLQPMEGHIVLNDTVFFDSATGCNLQSEKRRIGFVFQNYALWPHLTIGKNLEYPLKVRKMKKNTRKAAVEKMLALVHLEGKENRYPHELSGGEQQRAALGRAVIMDPALLLMDEPLSSLDAKLREDMQREIRQLQQKMHLTVLHVTHDQSEALSMSDRIIVMNKGRIIQEGTPRTIYSRPENSFVADFVGKSNLLKGKLEYREGKIVFLCDGHKLVCPETKEFKSLPQGTVLFSLRPEDILLSNCGKNLPKEKDFEGTAAGEGVIEQVIFKGSFALYLVRWGTPLLQVQKNSDPELLPGTNVSLFFRRMVPIRYPGR